MVNAFDIISIMKVKIISNKIQEFNGIRYYLCGNYYQNSDKKNRLHREVWQYHNGKIPKGCVIDHIDRDRNNNQINNLRLATYSMNNKNVSEETTKKRREHIDKVRHLSKDWHASEEGKKWHRENARSVWKNRKKNEYECGHCHKKFFAYNNGIVKYCSSNCKQRARTRRLKGLPEDYVF